jgi:hypothetical protein
MKEISRVIILLSVFFFANIYSGYSQSRVASVPMKQETKTLDVNKDGRPDVIYYSDGKHVSKIEADTNYKANPI